MKLLITGALGHIGSRLIHSIRPGEFKEVVLLDNLSTQRYCSLFNLPKNVSFRFIEEDVCTANLEQYFNGIDIVLHLAAITNAAGSFEIQDQVEKVNFIGTQKVAQACIKTKSKMIFLSTTSVYGTQNSVVDENCTQEELQPQSPYAESKIRAERFLHSLGETDGLNFVVCRFGTIFGTSIGMRFHTAINKFCWQAQMGQPITIWRTAYDQKRPYLDLSDAIEALRFIIETDLFDNQIYNVLTINATVKDIINLIKNHIPSPKTEFVDTKIMNQLSYVVSNEKIKRKGFVFKGDLKKGITETIQILSGIYNF
jgi:UDP-glucose 4-epimerase